MAGLFLLLILSAASALRTSQGFSDEHYSFPRLFHLDDYERCLANRDGLYCIGTFTLEAAKENSLFDLMKEYSENVYNFNRTRLYRGYCVSERCPLEQIWKEQTYLLQKTREQTSLLQNPHEQTALEQNATLRFERCVAKRARRYALSARLSTAECTSHEQHNAKANLETTLTQKLFLYALIIILMLNVLGTLHDVYSKPEDDKFSFLKCWSVPKNWQREMDTTDIEDPVVKQLSILHGYRAVSVISVMLTHVLIFHVKMYTYNPHYIEEAIRGSFGQVVSNIVSLLHILAMMSSLLTTYFIIKISEKMEISIKDLPLAILKRVIRVSPTYLFLIGFTATWLHTLGDGPLWSSVVGEVGIHCQKKFWAHALFLNNLIDNSDGYCIISTWFLAADLHTNILVSALTLLMVKWGRKAVYILTMLFTGSCVVIAALTYYNEWQPALYMSRPDNIRSNCKDVPGYHYLYLSSWVLLPACFIGMILAYLHVEIQKVRFKLSEYRLAKWYYNLWLPFFLMWLLPGNYLRKYNSPIMMALYVGFYRPMFCVISGLGALIAFHHQEHILSKFFAWKFWRPLSRLSLPVLMIHWIILMVIVGSTQHAMSSTLWDAALNWIVLVVTSYATAVPVAVLLEIPAQRSLGALVSRRKIKTC